MTVCKWPHASRIEKALFMIFVSLPTAALSQEHITPMGTTFSCVDGDWHHVSSTGLSELASIS